MASNYSGDIVHSSLKEANHAEIQTCSFDAVGFAAGRIADHLLNLELRADPSSARSKGGACRPDAFARGKTSAFAAAVVFRVRQPGVQSCQRRGDAAGSGSTGQNQG